MTPETVSQTALRLLEDVWLQSQIRGNYEKLRRQLGSGHVSERVAEAVAKVIGTESRRGA